MNNAGHRFFLVQMHFDARSLFVGARDRRLPLQDVDLGYLIHCQLSGLFGDAAPKPFVILNEKARLIPVLGYSNLPAADLYQLPRRFGLPEALAGCDWERFAARPVPADWKARQRVGFSLRACPLQRMAGDGPAWKKGAEVDVFLAESWKVGPEVPLDREKIYLDWLRRQFDSIGGAQLETARLTGFQREKFFRRAQGAPGPRVERPVAVFEGELSVVDPAGFLTLLRRGIGRHRAFGYGMLLLRPVGRSAC